MNKYEMTYEQFCENWLENAKYKKSYLNDSKLWEGKKRNLFLNWEKVLLERAEIGSIPENVLMSFISMSDEKTMFRTFKGVWAKGIQEFRIKEEA